MSRDNWEARFRIENEIAQNFTALGNTVNVGRISPTPPNHPTQGSSMVRSRTYYGLEPAALIGSNQRNTDSEMCTQGSSRPKMRDQFSNNEDRTPMTGHINRGQIDIAHTLGSRTCSSQQPSSENSMSLGTTNSQAGLSRQRYLGLNHVSERSFELPSTECGQIDSNDRDNDGNVIPTIQTGIDYGLRHINHVQQTGLTPGDSTSRLSSLVGSHGHMQADINENYSNRFRQMLTSNNMHNSRPYDLCMSQNGNRNYSRSFFNRDNHDRRNQIAHMRNLARPVGRLSSVVKGTTQSCPVKSRKNKMVRFFCMGKSNDATAPSRDYESFLEEPHRSLGRAFTEIDPDASSQVVKNKVEILYSRLRGLDFKLMRAVQGGNCNRALIPVDPRNPIPCMRVLMMDRIPKIYIVPSNDIITDEDTDSDDDTTLNRAHDDVQADNIRANNNSVDQEVTLFRDWIRRREESPSSINQEDDSIIRNNNSCSILHVEDIDVTQDPLLPLINFKKDMIVAGEQRILLDRKSILDDTFRILNQPTFDVFQKPIVEFEGEKGCDGGALRQEWFWRVSSKLMSEPIGGLNLFEGEENHKLPADDYILLLNGSFKTIARFAFHCFIFGKFCFRGLSRAAVDFLKAKNYDVKTNIRIELQDLSEESRKAVILLQRLIAGEILAVTEYQSINIACQASGFRNQVKAQNADVAMDAIKRYDVILKRKSQLEEIKLILEQFGILEFLRSNENFERQIFPLDDDIFIPFDVLIQAMRMRDVTSGTNNALKWMKSFINENKDAPRILEQLVMAWTGSGALPDGEHLYISSGKAFIFHCCEFNLEVPENMTENMFRDTYLPNAIHPDAQFERI